VKIEEIINTKVEKFGLCGDYSKIGNAVLSPELF
jgi:hypothetical protein